MPRAALLLTFLLVGCDYEPDPDDTDVVFVDGCPDGFHTARGAALTMHQLRVDGIDVFSAFDPNGVYGTTPSACISDDGSTLQLIFTVAAEPYGIVVLGAPIPDTFTANDSRVTFAVTLLATDEGDLTFSGGDWQTGLVDIRSVGTLFDATANGSGFSGTHSLTIQISAEAAL